MSGPPGWHNAQLTIGPRTNPLNPLIRCTNLPLYFMQSGNAIVQRIRGMIGLVQRPNLGNVFARKNRVKNVFILALQVFSKTER